MRVLLVEDDEILATLVAEVLTIEGHRVACAPTPMHALALLEADAWDLVITDSFGGDYDAPDEDELAHPRAFAIYAPVVMLTGRTWTARVSPAALGVAAILPKPFDLDDLLRTVASADATVGPDAPLRRAGVAAVLDQPAVRTASGDPSRGQ